MTPITLASRSGYALLFATLEHVVERVEATYSPEDEPKDTVSHT